MRSRRCGAACRSAARTPRASRGAWPGMSRGSRPPRCPLPGCPRQAGPFPGSRRSHWPGPAGKAGSMQRRHWTLAGQRPRERPRHRMPGRPLPQHSPAVSRRPARPGQARRHHPVRHGRASRRHRARHGRASHRHPAPQGRASRRHRARHGRASRRHRARHGRASRRHPAPHGRARATTAASQPLPRQRSRPPPAPAAGRSRGRRPVRPPIRAAPRSRRHRPCPRPPRCQRCRQTRPGTASHGTPGAAGTGPWRSCPR